MANYIPSAYMSMPVPVVGTDPGPDYATNINSCLTIVDSHDHSAGTGKQIQPDGLNITSDLTIQNNNLTNVRSVRFQPQATPLSTAFDLGCLYESGVDLFYNDGAGRQIQITQAGSIKGAPGTISGLPSGTASASYNALAQTFVFQSATSTSANIDGGSIILRDVLSGSPGLTLNPPAAMGSDYAINLPSLPVSTSFVTMDVSGNLVASVPTANGINFSMLIAAVQQALMTSGVILAFGGSIVPAGYLMCDGTSYLQSDYPTLFSVIGTAYGSADALHFNVPDLRGLFPRGVDNGAGNDPESTTRTASNPGGNTGDNVGSLQADAVGAHSHNQQFNVGAGPQSTNSSIAIAYGTNDPPVWTATYGTYDVSSPNGVETRPKNLYVNYIIKT
jgi:microcystin-dependent protein